MGYKNFTSREVASMYIKENYAFTLFSNVYLHLPEAVLQLVRTNVNEKVTLIARDHREEYTESLDHSDRILNGLMRMVLGDALIDCYLSYLVFVL